MAPPTNTENINLLRELVATLTARLDNHEQEVKGLRPEITEYGKSLSELSTKIVHVEHQNGELRVWKENIGIAAIQKDLALLQEKVQTLQTSANRSGSRWWAFWTAVVAAVIGAAVSGIITYFATRP